MNVDMTEPEIKTPPAAEKAAPRPKVPEGAREWIEANNDRMQAAYNECERIDLLLWFAARAGAGRRAMVKSIVLLLLALVSEPVRRLRRIEFGEASPEQRQEVIAAKVMPHVDAAFMDAITAAGRWSHEAEDGSAPPTMSAEERRATMTLAAAAADRSKEIGGARRADIEAGRLVAMMELPEDLRPDCEDLLRIRYEIAGHACGGLAWAAVIGDEQEEPGRLEDEYTRRRDRDRWGQLMTILGDDLVLAGGPGWGDFVRQGLPWSSLPKSAVWDAPAPLGRWWLDGEPWNGNPSRIHSWIGAAFHLGEVERFTEIVGGWMRDRAGERQANPAALALVLEQLAMNDEDEFNGAVMEFLDLIEPIPEDVDLDDQVCREQEERGLAGLLETLRARLPRLGEAIDTAATWHRSQEEQAA